MMAYTRMCERDTMEATRFDLTTTLCTPRKKEKKNKKKRKIIAT